ncbi:hypothetical protein MHM86_03015 [Thalassobius sp. Cn5-15]|nr:hypothetical protein [Thalassobius sp. Cn5-15]
MPSLVSSQKLRAARAQVLLKNRQRLLLGGVLFLQIAAPLPASAGTSATDQEQPVQTADHTVQMCVGGHQFNVPIIR